MSVVIKKSAVIQVFSSQMTAQPMSGEVFLVFLQVNERDRKRVLRPVKASPYNIGFGILSARYSVLSDPPDPIYTSTSTIQLP